MLRWLSLGVLSPCPCSESDIAGMTTLFLLEPGHVPFFFAVSLVSVCCTGFQRNHHVLVNWSRIVAVSCKVEHTAILPV